MKPSPILIGLRNLSRPGEPLGSHQSAGNPAIPASMTDGQGTRGANSGSQCPPPPPDSPRPRGANLQREAPRPDSLRPAQTPDSCLGVKGSRVHVRNSGA